MGHITEYTQGKGLVRHIDGEKNETLIIILSNEFTGGDTIIGSVKVELNKGDGVVFNGYNTYHEITKVVDGVRNALVLWYKPKIKGLV